ncbi:Broad-Complex, Tramtrack and Bric a brac [Rhizoctonia solani]|uniref:Broad-Complex, Tramtrack and Bric a brac n=1 Tax=Rhizoctonia solani TaxID=456999 RepID=A0A8H7IKB7_9AGAM|nr:Broad-Complex, Tramtrack and Bric a brac [Rhizoctonia solani]
MMENANSKNSSDLSVPLFNPPTGGDICLRSKDGIEFQAHTVLLGLASSVFRDMFLVGTRREEAIDLTEDATTISIMLEFIYPNRQAPLVTSFETLDNCLRISQKYDLQSMIQTLDTQLSINTTPQSLVHSDPLRAYQLALTFDLPKTKVMAAPLITTAKADLCEPSRLSRVVQSHPSASLIRLIGIQGTRAKILADVLFGFYKRPMLPTQEHFFYDLSCEPCRGCWICVKEMKLEQAYTPTTLPPGYYLGPTSFIKRYLLRLSSNAMTCFV